MVDSLALLTGEIDLVEREVRSALDDLRAPFGQLVQSQLRSSFPLVRAAFVLTAGMSLASPPERAAQRINLGAAIEILRLALAVHTRLLTSAEDQGSIDRSILGSTVLAGDFCFSRSAGLAAKTGSPVVVDIFAQSLQRVSEGTLRGLFRTEQAVFDVERELCLSGVAAANELANLGAEERQLEQKVAILLLDQRAQLVQQRVELPRPLVEQLPPARDIHWQALADWLLSR